MSTYLDYVKKFKEVPIEASLERGRVYHKIISHDDYCRFFATHNQADCDCNATVKLFLQPKELP